jgi:hypothetical protein
MNLTRRGLLAALAATAIAPGELWTPKRTIFLPPRGGWDVGRLDATEFGFFITEGGKLMCTEGGYLMAPDYAVKISDVLAVEYDRKRVRYTVNGRLLRQCEV